jgi:Mg-chelatase subunit ChlD
MASGGIVILCDTSGSMSQHVKEGVKINLLRQALQNIWLETPGASIIAFADDARTIEGPNGLPSPTGGTNLTEALERAACDQPAQCVVITDGRPDSKVDALIAADLIPGTIDTLFIGDERDQDAIDFLRELSQRGGGRSWVNDLNRVGSLISPLREALGLPSPIVL